MDIAELRDRATTTVLRPRYEGSNINAWMGFKHINYLAEEAVLEHFRRAGMSAHLLYHRHGVCVEIVEIDTRILTAFHLDDMVEAVVGPGGDESELDFTVSLHVRRGAERKKAASARVRVLLRRDQTGGPAEPVPDKLLAFTRERVERAGADSTPVPALSGGPNGQGARGGDLVLDDLTRNINGFAWRWRIPYFYCHFTERLQMSGYLRLLEQAVDLFLADRGVSIKQLLDEHRWIPVVTHSSVSMLDEVVMEEDLYTVLTVASVFKNLTYAARMDTYLVRDGSLLRTATGRITHGYAEIQNRGQIALVEFDERLLKALGGR